MVRAVQCTQCELLELKYGIEATHARPRTVCSNHLSVSSGFERFLEQQQKIIKMHICTKIAGLMLGYSR
jgi:hypothetical protein